MSEDLATGTRAARRRKAILDAALHLFAEQGFERVSVRAIGQKAGASTETIYRHFGDKEGLLKAVAGQISERMAGREEGAAFDPALPPEVVLGQAGRGFLEAVLMPDALGLYRLAIQQAAGSGAVAQAFWEGGPARTSARLEAYLARLAERGVLTLADPALAAGQFFGMLHGTLHMRVLFGLDRPDRALIETHVDAAVRLFLDGCRPSAP